MKTQEEVLALLVALGTTAEEVANSFVALGIKGDRRDCNTCPAAQYIIGKGVSLEISLGLERNYYWYPPSTYPQLNGVRDFIDAFDRGEYPQCER